MTASGKQKWARERREVVDSRGKVNHDIPLMMRAQSATTGSKNILFFNGA